MKQTKFRILRIFTALGAVVLLLGLATPKLQAEFECKQELMAGAWIVSCDLFGQGRMPPGPWSVVNLTVFDEQGVATTALQTNTTSSTPNGAAGGDGLGDDFLNRFDVRLTINPDCTGRFTYHEARSGHPFEGALIFGLDAVCANGQRECYTTFTETPPPGNTDPISIIGLCSLKKVDAFDQNVQEKVDALAADVVFLKELSKRIGAALGVLRREDVDK